MALSSTFSVLTHISKCHPWCLISEECVCVCVCVCAGVSVCFCECACVYVCLCACVWVLSVVNMNLQRGESSDETVSVRRSLPTVLSIITFRCAAHSKIYYESGAITEITTAPLQ